MRRREVGGQRTVGRAWFPLVWGVFLLFLVGCESLSLPAPEAQADRPPTVIITRPPSGVRVPAGQVVEIQSTATDDRGVVRVELQANGQPVRADSPPEQLPQLSYTVVQRWRPQAPGEVVIKVIAYDTAGQASSPAAITVEVVGPAAKPTSTAAPRETTFPATFTPTPSPTVVSEVVSGTVTVGALNVRAGPGTAFAVVERLRQGDTVVGLARTQRGDWVQVRLPDGRTGWVSARYLKWSQDLTTLPLWQPGQ